MTRFRRLGARFTAREEPDLAPTVVRVPADLSSNAHRRASLRSLSTGSFAVAQTAPMRALASPFWPSAAVLRDRARAHAWIVRACDSGYHPCSTVPMGADNAADEDAATDGRGQLRGVRGLTIADASLMPTIPSVNIHLPPRLLGARIGAWLRDG